MLLIKDGKIITMSGKIYNKGSILIKNKKIVKVGENINIDGDDDYKIIDASNCWVMPGIIEATVILEL